MKNYEDVVVLVWGILIVSAAFRLSCYSRLLLWWLVLLLLAAAGSLFCRGTAVKINCSRQQRHCCGHGTDADDEKLDGHWWAPGLVWCLRCWFVCSDIKHAAQMKVPCRIYFFKKYFACLFRAVWGLFYCLGKDCHHFLWRIALAANKRAQRIAQRINAVVKGIIQLWAHITA